MTTGVVGIGGSGNFFGSTVGGFCGSTYVISLGSRFGGGVGNTGGSIFGDGVAFGDADGDGPSVGSSVGSSVVSGEGLGDGEAELKASADGVGVGATGIGCFEAFGVGTTFLTFVTRMSQAHGVGLGVGEIAIVGDGEGDGLLLGEGFGVGEAVGLLLAVGEADGDGDAVGLLLAIGVGEGVGVGEAEATVIAAPLPGQVCESRIPEFKEGLSSAYEPACTIMFLSFVNV